VLTIGYKDILVGYLLLYLELLGERTGTTFLVDRTNSRLCYGVASVCRRRL